MVGGKATQFAPRPDERPLVGLVGSVALETTQTGWLCDRKPPVRWDYPGQQMESEKRNQFVIINSQQDGLVHHLSPPEAKIALFRSLFRGRDDVYPRRFENRKTGKSGYSPACGNEWVPGLCEKPRIKCAACPNQQFLAHHRPGRSLAPFRPRRLRARLRHGRLPVAPG